MFRFARLALAAAAVVAFVAPWPAEASLGIVKPDLKIASMTRAWWNSNYAVVVVQNVGTANSGNCTVRLIANPGAYYTGVDYSLSAMNAGSSRTLYIYVGPALAGCGTPVLGKVDFYGVVNESNESNNSLWYVAPPC